MRKLRGASALPLFENFFEFLIDHFAGEPINCNMQPIPLLTFHDKI